WSPDGKTLASVGDDGIARSGTDDRIIRLWEVATGKEVRRLAHEESVSSVAWAPDGKTLASAGHDKTVRLWQVATGKQLRQLAVHGESVRSVAWSPNGKTLASAGYDKTVRLWEAATGKEVSKLIEDLDDNRFSVRKKGTAELEQLAELAEPALRWVLGNKPSLEMRRRVEQLLEKVDGWSGERLRTLRAITVLENIAAA